MKKLIGTLFLKIVIDVIFLILFILGISFARSTLGVPFDRWEWSFVLLEAVLFLIFEILNYSDILPKFQRNLVPTFLIIGLFGTLLSLAFSFYDLYGIVEASQREISAKLGTFLRQVRAVFIPSLGGIFFTIWSTFKYAISEDIGARDSGSVESLLRGILNAIQQSNSSMEEIVKELVEPVKEGAQKLDTITERLSGFQELSHLVSTLNSMDKNLEKLHNLPDIIKNLQSKMDELSELSDNIQELNRLLEKLPALEELNKIPEKLLELKNSIISVKNELVNLSEIADNLKFLITLRDELNKTVQYTNSISEKLRSITASSIWNDFPVLAENSKILSDELSKTTHQLNNIAENLNTVIENFKSQTEKFTDIANSYNKQLSEFQKTVENIKESAEQMKEASKSLENFIPTLSNDIREHLSKIADGLEDSMYNLWSSITAMTEAFKVYEESIDKLKYSSEKLDSASIKIRETSETIKHLDKLENLEQLQKLKELSYTLNKVAQGIDNLIKTLEIPFFLRPFVRRNKENDGGRG